MPSYLKVPKIRDKKLRRRISLLPCVNCGVHGRTQVAHIGGLAEGKGRGLKVSDDTDHLAALCGPTVGIPGCHFDFDTHKIPADRGPEFVERTKRALDVLGD